MNNNRTDMTISRRLALLIPAMCFLLFLSFGNITASAASSVPTDFSGFTEAGSTAEKYGEFRFKIKWNPDAGYLLMLADKGKKNQCFIQFKANTDGVRLHGANPPSEPGLVVERENPLPDKPIAELECNVKLHQHSWSIYLDNKEIYRFRSPLTADSLWLQNQAMDDNARKIRFQKTETLYFHDDFLIADKDVNQLDSWEIISGKWSIHTALEAAIEQKTSEQLKNKPLEMERSPNFYSLKGSGENGLIVSGYPFHDNYLLQAAVQMQKGECGLAFYVQDEANFYTFTVFLSDNDESFAFLKRYQSGKPPVIMKAAKLQLLPDQWIMPRVQVMDKHISAYIDKIKVMELDEALPSGGQFGLFVNSQQTMFFDDVTAESLPYLELDDLQDVKFNTLLSHGNVFYKPGYFDWLFSKGKDLFPGRSDEDRWLVFGHPEDKTAVAGMTVKLNSDNANAGLIFGWKDQESPFFRFVYEQNGSKCNVKLEEFKRTGTDPEILGTAELPAVHGEPMPVSLKVAIAPGGMMKLFCNDKLAMLHREPTSPVGAAGVFVGKDSGVSVSNLIYRFKPEDVFRDKQEKNAIFANDPYMRNWANPAGEWIKDKELGFWHKSDFFSAFSLTVPIVENSEIHLGAKDEQPSGEIVVRLTSSGFEITECPSGKSLFKEQFDELFKKGKDLKAGAAYVLSVQDDWLWGEFDNELVFKVKLQH
ncbi:MAG: hypothetical protein WAX69_25960, partial [Victivallales bacterium]